MTCGRELRHNMYDIFRPKNQADCDMANALREYEQAHAVYMATPVHLNSGIEAKRLLGDARDKYTQTVKAARPTWIVM